MPSQKHAQQPCFLFLSSGLKLGCFGRLRREHNLLGCGSSIGSERGLRCTGKAAGSVGRGRAHRRSRPSCSAPTGTGADNLRARATTNARSIGSNNSKPRARSSSSPDNSKYLGQYANSPRAARLLLGVSSRFVRLHAAVAHRDNASASTSSLDTLSVSRFTISAKSSYVSSSSLSSVSAASALSSRTRRALWASESHHREHCARDRAAASSDNAGKGGAEAAPGSLAHRNRRSRKISRAAPASSISSSRRAHRSASGEQRNLYAASRAHRAVATELSWVGSQ